MELTCAHFRGHFSANLGQKTLKDMGSIFKKRVHLRRFTISTYMAKMPVSADFLHFHKHWSEPKIFVFKSSHQKQCRKAHNIGHFCQKDQTSISLRSKVRNRAKLTFQLAPKWQKVANGWILQIWLFSTLPSPQTTRRERFDVH